MTGSYTPVTAGDATATSGRRVDALDGVRAVAILAIMAFHSGVPGLDVGGFFSQDAFFVLSGLVITLILLREWHQSHRIGLGTFYARRIRRLIPALLAMLIVVTLFVEFFEPAGRYPGYRGDALAVLGYFSNWHFIAVGANYFAQGAAPSPLTHTWSLAIEEQFYLVWPPIVIAIMWCAHRRRGLGLAVVLAVSVLGALASAAWMAHLYRAGANVTRIYYGTDTHAQSILVGCALAAILTMIKERRGIGALVPLAESRRLNRLLVVAGILAALGLCWQWTQLSYSNAFTFQGGFFVGALLTAVILASVACAPSGGLARGLAVRPLTYLGTISYGMYLWYFPIFAYIDGNRTGIDGLPLFALRVAVDIALASASFFLIERPVREGTALRFESEKLRQRVRAFALLVMGLAATLLVVIFTTVQSAVPIGAPGLSAASANPYAAAPGATKVLLIGDSTALTLGLSLPDRGPTWNAAIDDQGVVGCGLAIGPEVRSHGVVAPPSAPCQSSTPPSRQWPAREASQVAAFGPQVVVLLAGRWEVTDRIFEGHWTNILDPAFQAYLRGQLTLAVHIATASGAHMVLLSAPCYSSGEQPNGSAWPEDAPARVNAYNDQLRAVAAQFPQSVSLVNLDAVVCPGGQYTTTINGVTVRAPDGIHFPYYRVDDPNAAAPDTKAQIDAFSKWIGPKLMPEIVAGATTPKA